MIQTSILIKGAALEAKRAIEEKNVGWDEAFKRGDAAGIAAFYAEDAVILPHNQPMVGGKQAIQKFFQKMIDQDRGIHNGRIVEFGVKGDLAYQVATIPITDHQTPNRDKFLEILRPQPDGSWKIHLCIWNSDQTQQEAPEPRQSP